MVKRKYSLIVKGRDKKWSFEIDALPEHVEDWREDGLELGEIVNTVPEWAVDLGLTKIWIRIQDIFNFRWR